MLSSNWKLRINKLNLILLNQKQLLKVTLELIMKWEIISICLVIEERMMDLS